MRNHMRTSRPLRDPPWRRPLAQGPAWLERVYRRIFARADIQVDGGRPWDIRVFDRRLYRRLSLFGSLGLGESYVEGWWDAPELDEFFARLMAAELDEQVVNIPRILAVLSACMRNLQSIGRARKVGEVHYDIGNDFYRAMLGPTLVYTCAYWPNADNLDDAQTAKLDLVCRKLQLQPGMRVLDIGCGWGSFARYAAQNYGVRVVGVTISAEQAEFARQYCAGLPVEIRLEDYREVSGRFDRIASLGMFEHVGHKNYAAYMDCVKRSLVDDGLFVMQTIGRNERGTGIDPWVTRYIFPNSEVPSLQRTSRAVSGCFVVEDLHNFGADYDLTLMSWFANFNREWPRFRARMPDDFYRVWKYYLLMFAGVFRARGLQLWQLVLAPKRTGSRYLRPQAL